MRHKFSALLLALALVAGALAQQQQQSAGVSAERLRAHVAHLASEKLGGRRTGTEGADLAARYIAEEFKKFGLAPAGNADAARRGGTDARAYLQKFPYVAAVELGKRNSMSFLPRAGDAPADARAAHSTDLRLGEDWTPLAWSASGRVERSPLVFVGYGIRDASLGHDDYEGEGARARGRIAVALAGTPDGDNPHGRFARWADLRFKAAAAREAGARALAVITREENLRDDRLARLRPDEGLAAGDAGLPVVLISRQVARRTVAAAAVPGVPFEKLEQLAGLKPEKIATGGGGGAPEPKSGNYSTELPDVAFSVETDVVKREAPAYNVVGVLEGSDTKLKSEAVVIGAHYDHLGRGGRGSLAQREGEIHYGADDNASGTAALLELARVISLARPRRTVVFAAFGGEEEGLLGSNFYVNRQPAVPHAQTVAMFNMDMIGRMKEDRLVVGGAGTAAEWRQLIERENATLRVRVHPNGIHEATRRAGDVPIVVAANGAVVATANPTTRFNLTLNEDGFGPSDHSSFYARQIPVLFFWTGTHEDYHKPSDTAERINYDGLLRVAEFVRDITRAVDANDARPTYTQAKSAAPTGRAAGGFRVYLGTIPSYAEGGDGMKLDGVREDSPAAKAGLRAGDVIVRMAGSEVKNVYDYTQALGRMKAGQDYEVEVLRGGERLKFKLTPAERR